MAVQKGNPKDINRFYGGIDKGSDKPAFCKPRHMTRFKEDTDGLRKTLETGMVAPHRRMAQELSLKEREKRDDQLRESKDAAEKIIAEDPDGWRKRRNEIGEEIRAGMPSRKDVKERRVNPHMNLKREKEGGLGQLKKEFIIISHAMGEDPNTSHLQRNS